MARPVRKPSFALVQRAEVASRTGELRYVQALQGILRGLHLALTASFMPHIAHLVGIHNDASDGRWSAGLEGRLDHFIRQLEPKTAAAFDKMAASMNKANAEIQTELLGREASNAGIDRAIAEARKRNVELVEKAGRDYAEDVRRVFYDPETYGKTLQEITDLLTERGNVSESRAALIARDQTYKLNAAMSSIRQEADGVEEYTWRTCRDDRVRRTHRRNEGKVFRWDTPPAVTGHPGDDVNCRCLPLPVLPPEPVEEGPETYDEAVEELMSGVNV